MSEATTPGSTTKSGFELVPNPAGTEEGVDGSPDPIVETGGVSPGLKTLTPEQQVGTPPAEQVTTPEQQVTETTQQQIPAKEDESRYEYWQSQAGKDRKELEAIKTSQTHAIARYIQKNPDMLDVVEEGMRGGPITRPKRIPERPFIPQKPDNYDLSEAHDPETVSGRFNADFLDYQVKKAVYDEAVDAKRLVDEDRNIQSVKLATLKTGVVSRGKVSAELFEKTVLAIDTQGPIDPEVFERFCLASQAPSQDEIVNQEKVRQLLAKQQGLASPLPLATAGGESPPQRTSEQEMADSMRAHSKIGLKGNLR